MDNPVNKIKLNRNLWFTFLGNKLIFGNSEISKGFHYTVSFGNRSGYFDLHMTNDHTGKHFTVFTVSHQEIYKISPTLLFNIQNSLFDLSKFDEDRFHQNNSKIYKIGEFGDLTEEFTLLTKKNKIIIDKDSPEFKTYVDKLIQKYKTNIINLTDLKKQKQFTGFIKSYADIDFIIKSAYFGDQIFIINKIDLDINSIFEKVLGLELYNTILNKINEGITKLKE